MVRLGSKADTPSAKSALAPGQNWLLRPAGYRSEPSSLQLIRFQSKPYQLPRNPSRTSGGSSGRTPSPTTEHLSDGFDPQSSPLIEARYETMLPNFSCQSFKCLCGFFGRHFGAKDNNQFIVHPRFRQITWRFSLMDLFLSYCSNFRFVSLSHSSDFIIAFVATHFLAFRCINNCRSLEQRVLQ